MKDEDLIGSVDLRSRRQKKIENVATLTQLGLTQRQISERLGISPRMVSYYIQYSKKVWQKNMSQSYEDYVAQEYEHYRILLKALEFGIQSGSWKHVETAIKLAERRSKLIGMDHSDRMEEARVRLEAGQLDLMTRAFNAALDVLGIDDGQRALATETLLTAIEGS